VPGVSAQCDGRWLTGEQPVGLSGPGLCAVGWDPDGAGPRTQVVVVGGQFLAGGAPLITNVGAFDSTTGAWEAMGFGVDQRQRAGHLAPPVFIDRLCAPFRVDPYKSLEAANGMKYAWREPTRAESR